MELTKKIIPDFLSGGKEMGALIRKMDWSKSSLGEPEEWPQSLRTAVSICLNSPFPILICWGKDLVEIYNDAYREIIGVKHPKAMGAKAIDVWPEIWDFIGSMLQGVLDTGQSTLTEDHLVVIERNGLSKKCYFTFSYSAIQDETGNIGGVFCSISETTKRVLLERSLAKQINNLFTQAPVAICILRGDNYLIEMINERMAEMWNRKRENIINKPVFDVLTELKDQGFKELLDNVYNNGERFVAEEMPADLMRNGKIENIFLKFIYEPLWEEDGTIGGVMALAHEITEQVVTRKKIEESEAFNRTVLESSPDCLKILDAEGRLLFMNSNGLCTMEIDDFNQFKNQPWWNLWADDNKQLVKDAIAKALTGETAFFQALGKTAKGTPKWWDVVVSPVLEEGTHKKVTRIISVSRDITEQKQAVIKLQESEALFRSLADDVLLFIFIIDPNADATISYWNKYWLDYTGQSFEEAVGRAWTGLIHPDDITVVMDIYVPAFTKRQPYTIPALRVKRHDGEYKWHTVKSNPRFLPNGEFIGYIGVGVDINESKLAEDALKESEHRYQEMVYSSPSMIAILKGEEMLIEIANDAILEAWGKGKNVLGKPLLTLLPELVDQGFDDLLYKVYTTGQPHYGYEAPVYFMRNGQRELYYYNFIYQAQRNSNNEIEGVAIIASEVTPQAIFNKKIKQNEAQFRQLVLQAPVAICVMRGEDYVIEIINESMVEMWGRKIDAVLNKPAFDVLPEFRDQGLKELLDEVYKTGVPFIAQELPLTIERHGKMENIFVKFVYEPLREIDGTIKGVMALAHEITDQVTARKKIEESELYFRMIADLMPAKITNADAAGGVLYYNKEWLDFTGKSFEELKDFGYQNIIHPDDLEKFKTLFAIAAEKVTVLEMEMRFMNKEGEYVWHINLASPVKDEKGKVKMWIGATTEIQKIKEEEQRKDNFIKMVSHELKTPVTSIKGYVQILLSMLNEAQQDSSNLKPFLTRIDKLVLRLSSLITELLDLSRIEAGRLGLKKELFNLNDLITEAVQDISFTNPKHTIKIQQDFNCTINGDKSRIEQVAINLITNAIKYSADKDSILLRIYKTPHNQVAVSVQDYGIGIDKKDHEKIFERFYRAGGKSEETYPGFGIGLFIVKEILLQHDGFITIESEKGKGAVFTFTLPYVV